MREFKMIEYSCLIGKLIMVAAALFSLTVMPCYPNGELPGSKYGIGLNYLGLTFKYYPIKHLSLELIGQGAENVAVAGIRSCYYTYPNRLRLFAGLEADVLYFKSADSKSNGFAGSMPVGLEFFVTKKFSFQMDVGPTYIHLKDQDTSEKVTGWDVVINFAVTWYFGGWEKDDAGGVR